MGRTARAVAVVAALTAAWLVPAAAAAADPTCTISWSAAANGNWERGASWDLGRVPEATDTVCLAARTVVRVNASTTVHDVIIRSAQLAAATGVTLRLTAELLVDRGTLAGPGTVQVGTPGGVRCCAPTGSITGPARLVRGVHLTTAVGAFTITGTLAFSEGSVLTNTGRLFLGDGTDLTDDDSDPDNAYVQPAGPAANLGTAGLARIGVNATIGGFVSASTATGRLDLPSLTNETPGGVLTGLTLDPTAGGRIAIPFPVTSLKDAVVYSPETVDVSSTGGPALSGTLRALGASRVYVETPTSFTRTLSLTRSGIYLYAAVSVPGMTLAGGARLDIAQRQGVRLLNGAGTLLVRPDSATSSPAAVVLGPAARIDGDFDQRGGVLTSNGSRITGDWSLGSGAVAALDIDRWRGPPAPQVAVGGALTVDGSLIVDFSSRQGRPPVGAVIRLVSAAGGVSGTFANVIVPAGYEVSYDATGVLVTRVS